MDEFLSAFGVSSESKAEDVTASEETTEEVTEDVTEEETTETEATPEEEPKDEQPQSAQDDKSAKAFAQMRIENKNLQKMIKGVAEVLGIEDTSNPENLTKTLQEKIIEAQAKKQNVPPEMLSRLQQLEEAQQEAQLGQIRQQAYLGFQKVKDMFKLSNQDLEAFAVDLQNKGINPFETTVDIVKEYKVQNMDRLIAEAEARGAQKEMERTTKAQKQSSTPNKKQGQQKGDGSEKITTISDLEQWMSQQSN